MNGYAYSMNVHAYATVPGRSALFDGVRYEERLMLLSKNKSNPNIFIALLFQPDKANFLLTDRSWSVYNIYVIYENAVRN